MDPEGGNAGQDEIIRSGNSMDSSFVMFVNGTNRIAAVYWIDHSGNHKLYIRLSPNAVVEINTYRSHAWIFRDAYSGERLHVQRQSVFWAQSYYARNPQNENELISVRKRLEVHLPIRTLREHMLWYLVPKLKSASEDAIDRCEIPKTLKEDLILVLRKVVAYRTSADLRRGRYM